MDRTRRIAAPQCKESFSRRRSVSSDDRRSAWCRERGYGSRQNRESARRKAEAVFYLRPGHDDKRAGCRHLIEVSHDLNLIMTVLENVGFRVHFVGRVGVHRFMAGRSDAALLVQIFDRSKIPGRKWAALETLRIGIPILVTVGAQRGEGAGGHAAVLAFPVFEILDRKGV